MNNCKAELKKGISKNQNEYTYILITKDNKEIAKVFIKNTEIPYYESLLNK